MSRLLIETIKCLDGQLCNLPFHQQRFNRARQEQFSGAELISLKDSIVIPKEAQSGLYRCRVLYAEKIEKIEFLPHQYREVKSLKLVEDNTINYHLKFADREQLNRLFKLRADCDDILIVKNGCITDSLTANPVFWDGAHWYTPDTPLLAGTRRAQLIEAGKIKTARISVADLDKFTKVGLINALQDLENMPVIERSKIRALR